MAIEYLNQERAPILEALEKMKAARLVPFDVPGHKRGRGNRELAEFLGQNCLDVDVNSMKMLDNLCHPVSVIRDAEKLAAEAFGAANSFFMVGGTTSSVQAMILSTVKPNEKIILPRNVHRSAINALILCGATPVYINPQVDERLGISLGMKTAEVIDAMNKNPCKGGTCQQSYLLRNLFRYRNIDGGGTRARNETFSGRGARYAIIFQFKVAEIRNECRRRYGGGFSS